MDARQRLNGNGDGARRASADIDCSRNPKAAQHLMGIVPDESNLYPELTGFENLCFCGSLYGMTNVIFSGL